MRFHWLYILVCAAMLVACSDDDSDFATKPSGESSSIKSSSSVNSSGSEDKGNRCDIETDKIEKNSAFSVRCVQD